MKRAAIVLVKENDKILAVSRRGTTDDFGLPGGKCEENEDPRSAASREFLEETGSEVCNLILLGTRQVGDFLVYTYSGEPVREIEQHFNEEDCFVKWIDLETLEKGSLNSNYNVRNYIETLDQ